jgi:hypothetical protein
MRPRRGLRVRGPRVERGGAAGRGNTTVCGACGIFSKGRCGFDRPSARRRGWVCARGGPSLPRPAFRSFLATAVDPSPKLRQTAGEGWWGGARASSNGRCFPRRDRMLPSPRVVCAGRGRGRGPSRAPVHCTSTSRNPSATHLPQQFWGRWASNASPEGAPRTPARSRSSSPPSTGISPSRLHPRQLSPLRTWRKMVDPVKLRGLREKARKRTRHAMQSDPEVKSPGHCRDYQGNECDSVS